MNWSRAAAGLGVVVCAMSGVACTSSVGEVGRTGSELAASTVTLKAIGTYSTGVYDGSAAEIVAHDAQNQRLFVANTAEGTVDVLDINDPRLPTLAFRIDVTSFGPRASSVAVHPSRDLVAAVVPNATAQLPGVAAFYTLDGVFESVVEVGANPDAVIFTPNGTRMLVANEGVPSDDYTVDPEGSISIVRIRNRPAAQADVATADFRAFNDAVLDPSIRIYGPGATVAQDLEPEFIAVSHDSQTAWVSLQENNALAEVDIKAARVVHLAGLGFKNHSRRRNALDASNKDDAINIARWPVMGMYQPDAIAAYRSGLETFVLLANEGDARDGSGFSEETRVAQLSLDPVAFPDAAALQMPEALGRLKVTTVDGDTDGDGDYDKLFSFGARSFSIRRGNGELVFDSGSAFERITAATVPDGFNSTNDENGSFDNRSDDKGPEPEGLTLGKIRNRTYAFIGLERVGGIAVYDVTDPYAPKFATYVNNRDFAGDPALGTAGDLAPEGLAFISKSKSPIHKPLLAVANEVSGTTTIYRVISSKK